MNARMNLLCLVAAALILALGSTDRTAIAITLGLAIITTIFVLALPRPRATTPRAITRLPTAHERHSGGSRWLYGLFIRIPLIPFISLGLFRWRGRK